MREELLRKLRERKNLQVALDLTNIQDAVRIAQKAIDAGADIIEAGTPLIKAEGYRGLRTLRENIGNKVLLADMKTADAGDIEVEIAKIGGSDIITVLGIMDDSTIEIAVKKARENEMLVEADLINVKDVVQRSKELRDLGVDIIGLHVGIDVQRKRGITVAELHEEIKEISRLGVLVSVAGGLNSSNIINLINLPINIYVVGSAITRSRDPYASTLEIVKIIKGMK
ncbi:MAG: orotidine 5'-phosphate decarboxylase / HUMPS family protein [Sulfolobaceae archaeon]